jgi:hypothetical protein
VVLPDFGARRAFHEAFAGGPLGNPRPNLTLRYPDCFCRPQTHFKTPTFNGKSPTRLEEMLSIFPIAFCPKKDLKEGLILRA